MCPHSPLFSIILTFAGMLSEVRVQFAVDSSTIVDTSTDELRISTGSVKIELLSNTDRELNTPESLGREKKEKT